MDEPIEFENPDIFEELFTERYDKHNNVSYNFIMKYREKINKHGSDSFRRFVNDVYSDQYICNKKIVLCTLYCIVSNINYYNIKERSEKIMYDILIQFSRMHPEKTKILDNKKCEKRKLLVDKRYKKAVDFINKNKPNYAGDKDKLMEFINSVNNKNHSIDRKYVLRKMLFSITTIQFRQKHKIPNSNEISRQDCYNAFLMIYNKYPKLMVLT